MTNVAIHEMNRIVSASGVFADGRPAFVLNEVPDLDNLPDTIWLSDGSTRPVAVVETGSASILPASGGAAGVSHCSMPQPRRRSNRGEAAADAPSRGGSTRLLRLFGIPGKRYGVEWKPSSERPVLGNA